MERKYLFFTLLGFFMIIVIILFFVSKSLSQSPSDSKGLSECNSLSFSSKDAINIVFFSSKDQAEKYKNYLFGIAPFDNQKEKFNFYYIDSYKPSCELYKGVALLCYSKEIVKKAASCPNDFIVVLDDKPNNIRSSSYLNVMSINKNSPLSVFAHEFGHALVAFDEEYVPASLDSTSKNCKSSCDDFLSGSKGCFEGCSDSEYFRSVDQGIMRTLYSNTYGEYDESIINAELSKVPTSQKTTLSGRAIDENIDCSQQFYYLVTGMISNGELVVLNITKEIGCYGDNGVGNYRYELVSNDNTVLHDDNFNPGVLYTDGQTENQDSIVGETYYDYNQVIVRAPAPMNAKEIVFTDDNAFSTSISITDINSMVCKIR